MGFNVAVWVVPAFFLFRGLLWVVFVVVGWVLVDCIADERPKSLVKRLLYCIIIMLFNYILVNAQVLVVWCLYIILVIYCYCIVVNTCNT